MELEEAEAITARIRDSVDNIRSMLLKVYTRNGWQVMGYASFHEYLTEEFKDHHHSYLRRHTHAALLEQSLDSDGHLVGTHPESHLRPLLELLDDDEQRMRAYWMVSEFTEEPTASVYYRAAKTVYMEDNGNDVLVARMSNGDLSINAAYDIQKVLETHHDSDPAFDTIASLCSDVELVKILASMNKRSETWEEIRASLCVGSFPDPTPLEKATSATLIAWRDVASAEQRAVWVAENEERYDARRFALNDMVNLLLEESIIELIVSFDSVLAEKLYGYVNVIKESGGGR
jgi:hypothetical protein